MCCFRHGWLDSGHLRCGDAEGVAIDFGGHTLHPVSDTVNVDASVFQNAMMGMNAGTIVVPDALVDEANLPLYYG